MEPIAFTFGDFSEEMTIPSEPSEILENHAELESVVNTAQIENNSENFPENELRNSSDGDKYEKLASSECINSIDFEECKKIVVKSTAEPKIVENSSLPKQNRKRSKAKNKSNGSNQNNAAAAPKAKNGEKKGAEVSAKENSSASREKWAKDLLNLIGPNIENKIKKIKDETSFERQVVGMINTGNTCYRSSVFQCLLACRPLLQLFRDEKILKILSSHFANDLIPTWKSFYGFCKEFQTKKNMKKAINPQQSLGNCLLSFRSCVAGQQEDAEEFLSFFLDKLHLEIENLAKNNTCENKTEDFQQSVEDSEWQEVGKGGVKSFVNRQAEARADAVKSIITTIFYANLRYEVKRPGETLSVMIEPFNCLQLPVPPQKSSKNASEISIVDLMGDFFADEILEGVKGEKTGSKTAKRRTFLESLPNVLTVNLKQYNFVAGQSEAQRIGRDIKFSHILEVPDKFLGPFARLDAKKNGRSYQLFAAVVHFGKTSDNASAGHYIAFVKNKKVWLLCDDSKVTEISESHVIGSTAQFGGAPYLLFYERQPK